MGLKRGVAIALGRRATGALLVVSLSAYGVPLRAGGAEDQEQVDRRIESARRVGNLIGQGSAEAAPEGNPLLLNVGAIDTASPEAAALRGPVGPFEGKRLHLVQFVGPIRPEWYKSLEATGVEVVQYIPFNAYLVYGDSSALARLQDMARQSLSVQWDGPYLDRYKVQAGAQAETRARLGLPADRDLFAIQLVLDPEVNVATARLVEESALEPVISRWEILKYVNLVVALPVDAVAPLAARADVVSIDRYVTPEMFDERQDRIVTGQLTGNAPTPGDHLAYLAGKGFTQAQFTASSFVVDVTDSGIDNATTTPNHFGLRIGGSLANPGRVQYNRLEGTPNPGSTIQGCDGHGNINAHIVGGYVPDPATLPVPATHADGSGFRYGLGVCPFVKVGSSVVFDPQTFTNPNLPNLQARAYNDNARLSTNSWGANVGGAYTSSSQTFDALVRDAQPASSVFPTPGNQEMVVIFAAGNAGPAANTTGAPGTAKNVITVGASEGVQAFGGADGCGIADTGADSANDIIPFSSRGPTDDGRIKPEIVAPGTHISGGVFQASASTAATGAAAACFNGGGVCGGPGSNFFPTTQQFYTASSGTSHSTPGVAGGAALVRQHFINNTLTPPSPALSKALLVNSARYMTGVAANDTLPSNNQGMGMMNLDTYFSQMAAARILRDQVGAEMFTASGQQRSVTGDVASGGQPFRVTLAWTDTPGPTSGNAFVNNLDLEVTVGGVTYKGNVFSGPNSVGGGNADPRNNVESVFIPAGVTGPFTVRVIATNIAGDGVPNVGGPLDQDYALVIVNAIQVDRPVIATGTATLTSESCGPANGALDPNETVTLSLCLQNIGALAATNAVATLQATGGVTSPSGPQAYGMLNPGGAPACRNFTFTVANLSCGANVTSTLQVQDGATNLGNVAWTFTTGVANVVLSESFDGVTPPALPAGWTNLSETGPEAWTTVATTPDTPPNAAFINDPSSVSLTSLITPNIPVPTTTNPVVLGFRHSYNMEPGFDGGVLELKIGAGAFQDILVAGGSFVTGGYTHTLSTGFNNPLPGRQAWSGNSGGYVTTTVNLPASVSGQTIQIRWRRGSDQGIGGVGWRVDTISLQAGRTCCVSTSGADLAITKTDGVTSAVPGQPLTYTIIATNAGPNSVTGATVTDTFPAALTGVSWTCTAGGGASCTAGPVAGNINDTVNLPVGGSVTYVATGTINPSATGTLVNTATVSGPLPDPVPANNSATDTDTLTPQADLEITKTGPPTATTGSNLIYTIVVQNQGPSAASGVLVDDPTPTGLGFLGNSGDCSTPFPCAFASLAPGAVRTISATFSIPLNYQGPDPVSNTASVTGTTPDPSPANNSSTEMTPFPAPGTNLEFFTVTPCRVLDTRTPAGAPALDANVVRVIPVGGVCNIPMTARAISANVTVTGSAAGGNVRLWPSGGPIPLISTINYSAGQTRGNNGILALSSGGSLAVIAQQGSGTVHLIVDVNGYFE